MIYGWSLRAGLKAQPRWLRPPPRWFGLLACQLQRAVPGVYRTRKRRPSAHVASVQQSESVRAISAKRGGLQSVVSSPAEPERRS